MIQFSECRIMTKCSLSVRIALLGGIGRCPCAGGTVATVFAGIPVACLLGSLPVPAGLFLLFLAILASCYVSEQTERAFMIHDPKEIVIDEVAGYLVTMMVLPITLKSLLLGVVAFRLFDIWKPWPINVLDQRVAGGVGVVLDDLAAGVYAHVTVWIVLFWLQ
jgi:phosphatidylglycerophosphatase A